MADVLSPGYNDSGSYEYRDDSIMDSHYDRQRDSIAEDFTDSLIDSSGRTRSNENTGSIFGDDHLRSVRPGRLPVEQYRPLSMYSFEEDYTDHDELSAPKENDTMVSVSVLVCFFFLPY